MLIFIFLQLVRSKFCADYGCSTLPINGSNQCIDKVGFDYTLNLCTEEYYSYCPPSYADSFCQLPPVSPDFNIAVPGEPCNFDRNCLNSVCIRGFCKGLTVNAPCSQHTQCDVQFFCNSTLNQCKQQNQAGAVCSEDYECINSCGCSHGICTRYFSLQPYAVIENCTNNIDLLCISGNCRESQSSNFCVPATLSSSPLPILCFNEGDCVINITTSLLDFTYSTGCVCGFNSDANAYCNLAPGDDGYRNYTQTLNQWFNSSNVALCHTTARTDMKCISSHWDAKHYITLAYYQALIYWYPMIQQNDQCIQSIYTPDYWSAKAAFDAMNKPVPKHSFGEYIVLGVIFIVLT